MKYFLWMGCLLTALSGRAQITITASDMPVAGDTLRYSNVLPTGSGVNTSVTGPAMTWNYSFAPISQGVDTYQLAVTVNPLYAFTAGVTAYGYKIADSLPGLGGFLPVSIQELYDFFEIRTGPSRFEAKAFGATFSGFPLATNYAPPDVWYFFPLAYGNSDSSGYALNLGLDTVFGLKETGYRVTTVDGWGTIQTPYFTTPVSCIRVRSEIHEIDSITFSGFSFGVPRHTVEYKWMVNGSHYPALWVTSNVLFGNEVITSIRYRDGAQGGVVPPDTTNEVPNVSAGGEGIAAYPVPTIDGRVTLTIPAAWASFVVEVFDMTGKEVSVANNERVLDLHSLPSGQYLARIVSGSKAAYVRISR